ncbi:MAG TPA: hypothetical protein VM553_00255, partial [Dongiaceae bacterium]|nr:hypothetical protein [Dongiaceae bacterium]
MPNPVTAPAWQRLQALQKQLAGQRLTALFDQNSQRFTQYSAQVGNLFVDYSKNFIDDASLDEL